MRIFKLVLVKVKTSKNKPFILNKSFIKPRYTNWLFLNFQNYIEPK